MEELFARAERERLWFWSQYQDLWFSPAELRAEQKRGAFCWGPENWRLRDPNERLVQLTKEIDELYEKRQRLIDRMAK